MLRKTIEIGTPGTRLSLAHRQLSIVRPDAAPATVPIEDIGVLVVDDGRAMMQFSVYSRHCASLENAEVHISRMGERVPSLGEVRFLTITDRQFSRIRVFLGKKRAMSPPPPAQLELF
jgi:CRISPR-associated protein Cas2